MTSVPLTVMAVLHFILHQLKDMPQLLIILSNLVLRLTVQTRMVGCLFIILAEVVV